MDKIEIIEQIVKTILSWVDTTLYGFFFGVGVGVALKLYGVW